MAVKNLTSMAVAALAAASVAINTAEACVSAPGAYEKLQERVAKLNEEAGYEKYTIARTRSACNGGVIAENPNAQPTDKETNPRFDFMGNGQVNITE